MFTKTALIRITFFLFAFTIYAQATFEKGYYINNKGQKIEGYIKNLDWQKTPEDFLYKKTLEAESSILKLSDAREFGSENIFKFLRAYIDVDISPKNLNDMTTQKEPVYERIEAFVKTLVEGQISLYEYYDGNIKKYFYSELGDKKLVPLISKKYLAENQNIVENNAFRNQLYQLYDLALTDDSKIKYLKYQKKSLSNFVSENNKLKGFGDSYTYKRAKAKDWFRLHIRPGVNFSSLEIEENSGGNIRRRFDLDAETSLRVGILGEFILPFNNNKWSILVETTYQSYSQVSDTISFLPNSAIESLSSASVDISSLEIGTGIRHYLFLSEKSAIYANIGLNYDLWLKQDVLIDSNRSGFRVVFDDFGNSLNFSGGIGFKYDRFALEFNLQSNHQLGSNSNGFDTGFSTTSFILSYQLF